MRSGGVVTCTEWPEVTGWDSPYCHTMYMYTVLYSHDVHDWECSGASFSLQNKHSYISTYRCGIHTGLDTCSYSVHTAMKKHNCTLVLVLRDPMVND